MFHQIDAMIIGEPRNCTKHLYFESIALLLKYFCDTGRVQHYSHLTDAQIALNRNQVSTIFVFC